MYSVIVLKNPRTDTTINVEGIIKINQFDCKTKHRVTVKFRILLKQLCTEFILIKMFGKLVLLFAIFVAIAVARPQYYPNYGYNGYGASYPGYYGYSGYSSPVGYTGYGSYSSPYNYGYGYY